MVVILSSFAVILPKSTQLFPSSLPVFVHRVGRVARAGSSGVAYSLVGSEEFAYMMDLHLFLSRPLQFVTTQSTAEEDGLIGGVPQHLIDEEDDIYKVGVYGAR